MKIRVYKIHLSRTIQWYQNKLDSEFGSLATNENLREIIRRRLDELYFQMKNREKTNSWQIPLKVVFLDNGRYYIDMADASNVLFLDDP